MKLVDTDCGSHTNTLIPDPAHGRVLIYVLSYYLLPGPKCGDGREANPLHAEFSIVSVPLAHPQDAAVVATPAIDAEPFSLDGLGPTIGCHDIGVFMPLHLAAVACLSEAQLWDISDPLHPKTLAHIQEPAPGFEIWHSATWSWDGKYIVFGDESESGSCHADQTEMDGRVWFYRLSDLQAGGTAPVGSFLIPRDQGEEYCSAHMFNVVPLKDRYLLTSSWYGGGVDVIDSPIRRTPARSATTTSSRPTRARSGPPTGTTASSTAATSPTGSTPSCSAGRNVRARSGWLT